MNKSVIVIDTPETCSECRLFETERYHGCRIGSREHWEDKPKWCPSRPLPQKSTYEIADDHPFTKAEIMAYTYGITVGRNQVIEEITDESNISD